MECMASTESFCQELENDKGMKSKEKAQRIRNITVKHLWQGCQLKLKSNLEKKELKNYALSMQIQMPGEDDGSC